MSSAPRRFVGALLCGFALACATPSSERPVADETGFRIIAHRGGAGSAPENTLAAIERSLAHGFHEVELDVRLSLDEVLVLFHDDTLERKTGHEGSVGVYSAEELAGFEIGTWFDLEHPEIAERYAGTRLVALETVFDAFGAQLYYHLEIKGEDPRVPALLRRAIAASGLEQRVTVTAFSFDQLVRFGAGSGVPVCWLFDREVGSAGAARRARQRARVDRAAQAGFEQVAVVADEIDESIVRYAHANGLGIRAWGVHSETDALRVIAAGSDGATTDWPERLRAALAVGRSQQHGSGSGR